MLRSYLTVALRTLRRHSGHALLNVAGLAIGIACCLLIALYVRDELRYDRFHTHADRIYRIVSDWGDFSVPATSWPVVARLNDDFPDVTVARLLMTDGLVQRGDRRFTEDHLAVVNPAFLDVFTFPLQQGDPATALTRPFTAVLTPEMAATYFGDEDPIGQTLEVDNTYEVEITGVLAPVPDQTHVHFDALISWSTLEAALNYSEVFADRWGANGIYTYLLLPEGRAPHQIEAQFPDFIARHAGGDWNGATLALQPLTEIHLYSHHNSELAPNGDIAYLYVFGLIGVFILLIACINFINLATARSAERAKEVGVRKAIGAHRAQLAGQFLAESMVMATLALVLALGLVSLGLPLFNALTGKALTLGVFAGGFWLFTILGVTVLTGLLAGGFPALVLSGFQPVTALRGAVHRATGSLRLRQGLVVLQFTISVGLIIGTIGAYRQVDYLRTARLGFDQEQVLLVPMNGGNDRHRATYEAFREALLTQTGIEQVTAASTDFPSELLDGHSFGFEEAALPDDALADLRIVAVEVDFFETLGVDLLAGRAFSRDFAADSGAYILNQAAFERLARDLPEPLPLDAPAALNLHVRGWGGWPEAGPLIGVAPNFNMATLHEAVEPIVFLLQPDWTTHYVLRVRPDDLPGTLASLEATWQQFFPDWPLAFSFADAAFDARYRYEERLAQTLGIFAGLAILIACLGLFGLAAFTAQQRTKEIGIRKVLGASVAHLVVLLSSQFVRLVILAFVIAMPLAYVAVERWLDGFAYRTELGWWVFAVAGGAALGIALLTVSYHAIRASLANPVRSLRYE